MKERDRELPLFFFFFRFSIFVNFAAHFFVLKKKLKFTLRPPAAISLSLSSRPLSLWLTSSGTRSLTTNT